MRFAGVLAAIVAATLPSIAAAQSTPSDYTWATRYDLMHRVTGTIDPDPDGTGPLHYAAVRNTYDDAGRLVTIENGELSSWQSEAIAPANWTGFIVFSRTDTTYDGMDRKTTETTSSGGTAYELTQYSYDAVGRLQCTTVRMNPAAFASLPDACTLGTAGSYGPDRITRNVYDDAGQLLKVQKAYGTPLQQDYVTYTYTDDGKQATVTDANGNKAAYTYDGFDRLSQWNFPDKTSVGTVSATDYEAYTYDANGNRTSLRKRDGSTISYSYDALNRLTFKDEPTGSDVYYGYDLQGHQLYARFGSAAGDGITNSYDGFGRLAGATIAMAGTSRTLSHQYDPDGNRTRLTFPDNNYIGFAYDGLDRAKGAAWGGDGSAPNLWSITYDAAGRRGSMWHYGTTTYGYDPIGRLGSLTHDFTGTTGDVATTFAYNPASQIVTQARSNDAYAFNGYVNVDRSYATNGLNQYTSAGSAAFIYDMNGNLTSDGSSSYVYDVENRLVSASGAANATLVYDPLGRLFQVSTPAGAVTQFLYDGDNLVGEYDGTGAMTRHYIDGPGSDEPIAALLQDGATWRFLYADHQGSVVGLGDINGAYVQANSYDEYGIPGAANTGRFQYTGQVWMPELGMYYYKARMYSPSLGRFMQTDPVGYKDQINLYAYVANDPVNGTDPSGECPWCFGAIVGGGLELGLQLATPQGRAAYAAAARAVAHGNFSGAWRAAGANVVKVGLSATAGAAGVGIASKVAEVANIASKAAEVGGVGKILVNAGVNAAGNAAAGAGLGAAAQAGGNLVSGQSISSGTGAAAIGGAAGGAVGSLTTGAVSGETQNLATATGSFVGGHAGVAAPGVVSSAAERAGGVAGPAAERAMSSCGVASAHSGSMTCR